MTRQVPCPAHGSYRDREGRKQYYRSANRVLCLLHPYDACRKCEHTEFEIDLVKADTSVECPIVLAAAEGPGNTNDLVRNADINRVRSEGGSLDALITLNTCASDMPFQVCSGCLTRRRWTRKPSS